MSNQNLYYVGINVETGRYVRMKSVVPGTITIDTQLDPLSQNPVANATLYTVLETKLTIPGGGSAGQAIVKTSNGFGWSPIPVLTIDTEIDSGSSNPVANSTLYTALSSKIDYPAGGSDGQVLTQSSGGVMWSSIPETTVDSSLSSFSPNPIANSAVYSALQGKASTDLATTSTAGLMAPGDKSKLDGLVTGYLGYYISEYALYAAHPLGSNGEFAAVGDTKSLWVWDSIGSQWFNASVSVDSSLDASSSNPVENRAVTSALNTKITMPSGGSAGQVLTKTADGTQWASAGGGGGTSISTLSITRPVYMDYLYPVLEAADNQSFTSAITMSLAEGQTTAQSKCKVFNGIAWDNYADVGPLNYSYDNMPLVIDMSYFSALTEPYWVRWKWVVDDSSSESTASDWESTKFPSAGDAEGQKVYNPVTGNIAGIKIAAMTQEQYDLLDPKDANTIYLIVDQDESSSISGSI